VAVRVVVTGVDSGGVSRVERDGRAAAEVTLSSLGGVGVTYPWQVAVPPAGLKDGGEPKDGVAPFLPPQRFLNFFQLLIPPHYPAPRDDDAIEAIINEVRTKLPGLLPTMDPAKGPAMHRTPTLDLLTVTSGRAVLRLDDGSATELTPGDCVVQRGTMHAWHNPYGEPCTLTGVMLAVLSTAG
jgi:mannose-6-phosphate isomerase-like protein (cupin superfamily)